MGNNFFYDLYKTQNPSVVYDEENTYLDITNTEGTITYTINGEAPQDKVFATGDTIEVVRDIFIYK